MNKLTDLWYDIKSLDDDLKEFNSFLGSYKDQKLISLILKYRFPFEKHISDFSPDKRKEVIHFISTNYGFISKIVWSYK